MMTSHLSRRNFLKLTAAGVMAAGVAADEDTAEEMPLIPRRKLGRTDMMVSMLGFGGGSAFSALEDDDLAEQLLNEAIDSGINYFDTAHQYGGGRGETLYGRVLGARRDEVFIATKIEPPRNRDWALKCIQESLERLQTDHVDLLQLHDLLPMDEIPTLGSPNGIYTVLQELREQGLTRFIGITSHRHPKRMLEAVDTYEFDTIMMPLNATGAGGFESELLPAVLDKKMGVIAMKMAARGNLIGEGEGKADAESLLRYSLSLRASTTIVGMADLGVLRANVQLAQNFEPMTDDEKNAVISRVAGSRSRLAYLEPGYRDHVA